MHKYIPKSVVAVQGHFNQARKNEIYTQVPITMDTRNAETRILFSTVVDAGKV